MPEDPEDKAVYHEAAVEYNDEFAIFADELADKVQHPTVKQWCRSIAKQHKFHAGRHRRALKKVRERDQQSEAPHPHDENNFGPPPLGHPGRVADELTSEEIARLDALSELEHVHIDQEEAVDLPVGPDTESRAEADVETEEERNQRLFEEAQARAEQKEGAA